MNYDIIIIDIDSKDGFQKFEMERTDKNYFVTGFDNYSLRKGLEIIGKDETEKMLMTKIMFSRRFEKSQEEYLNFLSFYYDVKWSKGKIWFPYEMGDGTIIIENQRSARISYRELSQEYRSGIYEIVSQIAPEVNLNNVKKMLRNT